MLTNEPDWVRYSHKRVQSYFFLLKIKMLDDFNFALL